MNTMTLSCLGDESAAMVLSWRAGQQLEPVELERRHTQAGRVCEGGGLAVAVIHQQAHSVCTALVMFGFSVCHDAC
jgi:hypothetical protein